MNNYPNIQNVVGMQGCGRYVQRFDLELWNTYGDVEFLNGLCYKLNECIDVVNLTQEQFKKIIEFVDTMLDKYAKDQLQKWLDDGTLERIINETIFNDLNTRVNTNTSNITTLTPKVEKNEIDITQLNTDVANNTTLIKADKIYSESDFTTFRNSESWVLMNDIMVTKTIGIINKNKTFNLNGYKITISPTYPSSTNDLFLIGYNADFVEESKCKKRIYNGIIDFNHKDIFLFETYLMWNLTLDNVKILNNVKGIFNNVRSGPWGAECVFSNLSIHHSSQDNNRRTCFEVKLTDSVFENIYPVYYDKGFVFRAGSNVIKNCHPWGYPKTDAIAYPDSTYMSIGFVSFSSNNTFIDCIADTMEPLNTSQEPSYANGGIGFYMCGTDLDVTNCYTIAHSSSRYKKHIGYYFADTNPETSLPNYIARCSLNYSHVNIQGREPLGYKTPCVTEVPIQMIGNGFNTGATNNSLYSQNQLLAENTFFKNEIDYSAESNIFNYLPENNSFKITSLRNAFYVIMKDTDGTLRPVYLQTARNLYINSFDELTRLKTTLTNEMVKYGSFLTSYVYTVIYTKNSVRNLVMWDANVNKFYYVKDGTEVTD